MLGTARAKVMMRNALGDGLTTSVHAVRFAALLTLTSSDEPEIGMIPYLVKRGDVCIDVGANGADWTKAMAERVGPSGRVYAYEADPYYAEVTRKTINLLRVRGVTFLSYGLSDREETTNLVVLGEADERLSGRGHVVRTEAADGALEGKAVPVRLTRLEQESARYRRMAEVRLIKCDVEGFELEVFMGARHLLETARPVIVAEVGHADQQGRQDDTLFDFLEDLGYASYVMGPTPTVMRRSRASGDTTDGHRQNRVFFPTERDLPPGLVVVP